MKINNKTQPKNNKKPIKITIDSLNVLSDHILVSPETVERSKGLIKPDQYEDKQEFGTVVKVGEMVEKKVKVGDVVLFGKWSTTILTIDGNDYLMMREEDVIAVIK